MKVYSETIAPSGKKRILFGCGIEDIKILKALVENAKHYTPRIKTEENSTLDMLSRLCSMSKAFSLFLYEKEPKPSKDKNTPCPYCERVLRGEKALENHIKQVHSKQL
jgi:hypothetical protein